MISKTEKSIIGKLKMAFPLPLLLALLFAFSFSIENFAQNTADPEADELQTFKPEAGKIYLYIPAGEDFEEKKAEKLAYLEEQHGEDFSPENVVFLTTDQMNELAKATKGPSAVNEGSYALKWEGTTISQNAMMDKNTSDQPLTLYVNGKAVQLISNKLILQVPLENKDGGCEKNRVRRAFTMQGGVLPEDFYEFMDENDSDLVIRIFDLVYNADGIEKTLEEMTTFSVKN